MLPTRTHHARSPIPERPLLVGFLERAVAAIVGEPLARAVLEKELESFLEDVAELLSVNESAKLVVHDLPLRVIPKRRCFRVDERFGRALASRALVLHS